MVSFSWLHLTDLHVGMNEQHSLLPLVMDRFFLDLESLHQKSGPWDAVIFSGDLTQSGKAEEYEKVNIFLHQLWDKLKALGSQPFFLAVPGNHDLERPNAKDAVVKLLCTQWANDPDVQTDFWGIEKESVYRPTVTTAFKNYVDWWAGAPFKPKTQPGLLPGDFSATIEKEGARIGVLGLNTTFLQLTGGDYTGRLAVDARQFQDACGGNGPDWVKRHNACLLVTHQPPEWLTKEASDQYSSEIAGYNFFALHLCGHLHEAYSQSLSKGGGPVCRLCQGASLFGLESFGEQKKVDRRHGYAAGRIDLDGHTGSLMLWPRRAFRPQGQWNFAADNQNFKLTDDHTEPEPFELLKGVQSKTVSGSSSGAMDAIDGPFRKRWAILIGVNDYKYVTKLSYCRNDAIELGRSLRQTLKFPDDSILEFHEQSERQPDRDSIFKELGELRDSGKIDPNDLLIFYFSGHGMNVGNKDYLLPIGAPARDVKNLGISMEDLVGVLQETHCKNIAMFIDACREPEPVTGVRGTGAIGKDSADIITKAGIVAFFSCDPRDRSYEIDELQHGSFTYCLLEAIKQSSATTVSELDSLLKTVVPQVNTTYKKPPQQPYSLIQPPDLGKLAVLHNPERRQQAALQFEPLIVILVRLSNDGKLDQEDFLGGLQFLDKLKDKAQLDSNDKTKLVLLQSVCGGRLTAKTFHSAWQAAQARRCETPQIKLQMFRKLPRLGTAV